MADHESPLNKVLKLVKSSQRVMPAYFMNDEPRQRTKSFCIDFAPLDAHSEYEMASEVWASQSNFFSKTSVQPQGYTESELRTFLKIGEDIMVGAFILAKLGASELLPDFTDEVFQSALKDFRKKNAGIDILFLYETRAEAYFTHCADFGTKIANGKPTPYSHLGK